MKVTVYSTTTCPYCEMVKKWLKEHNIEFDNIYIDKNKKAAQEMIKLSGQMSTPFTVVEDDDGKVSGIIGYNLATLKSIFN